MVERIAQETLSHFYMYNQTPEMNQCNEAAACITRAVLTLECEVYTSVPYCLQCYYYQCHSVFRHQYSAATVPLFSVSPANCS